MTTVPMAWQLGDGKGGIQPVALELDNDRHFLIDPSGREGLGLRNGVRNVRVKAKNRLLKALGWKVTHLSSHHWNVIRKRPLSEQAAFWSKKLKPLGILSNLEKKWHDEC